MSSVEKYGVDVEEAVRYALQDLRLSRDEVEVEVLEEPSRGFLGLGQKLARVKVSQKRPPEPEKKPEPEVKAENADKIIRAFADRIEKKEPASQEARESSKPQKKEGRNRKRNHNRNKNRNKAVASASAELQASSLNIDTVDLSELTEVDEHVALTFIREITEKMGLDLDIKARVGEDMVHLEIVGKDSGTVIGKRGATLDAIQYLTSLVVNKDSDKYIKVVVDAEKYRSKRQKTLEALANRLASKVERTRKYVKLEPMNPYERKIIHATLQKNSNVVTRSEGEEPYRRVIIDLKK